MANITSILNQQYFSHADLIILLKTEGADQKQIFEKAAEIKKTEVGNKVYFRGLIEYSNICSKDCFYCGVRKSNSNIQRYQVNDEEVIQAAQFAYDQNFASIVIQSGERSDKTFVKKIENLIREIKKIGNGALGITLSCGEQSKETYKHWFDAGVHRYLLRIETSNEDLYQKIHPQNNKHNFNKRIQSLYHLKETGFQVGTGVMIGLPFQTLDDLANDLLFFKKLDIDMAGMGPYIEHKQTPLYQYSDTLLPLKERFQLSLKIVALLRILMKGINIAATTAMQTIDPEGREKALLTGANVIMPNLTPLKYREDYLLYEDKPCIDEEADACKNCLEARIHRTGNEIGYNEWGDSLHFKKKRVPIK
ncbi:MAG: [FeFe] hydrogenase H-cluster radical SAM maturase HydE [Bacteroidales bacterium]|jgi:biotin synthase|nr:[FeFe] hydrogenase H-cluster radical SAM maturase HydE [Bacteroidales bacterium]